VGGETEALEVDHVVAATGYRPSLSTVGYLAGDRAMLVESGTESPVLSAGFEASQSGICFTGALAAASFGPSQLFLPGISIACRGVIRTSLVRRLRGSPSATMVSPGGHHMRE
jgi:hypothetical protein